MPYQLHLWLGDDLERDLRGFADAYGLTIAAAVRLLMREALDKREKPSH